MTWGLKRTAALIIGIYLLFCAGLLYWVVIYSGSGDGDTLEHVHSSWLVWSGKIPYKDFSSTTILFYGMSVRRWSVSTNIVCVRLMPSIC